MLTAAELKRRGKMRRSKDQEEVGWLDIRV